MRIGWRIALIWVCFLARVAFYATVLPLWEGYDEWAHFAVIRTMVVKGEPLVARDQPVPLDVGMSLQLAPVPWELRYLPSPSLTQDAYWALPDLVKRQREAAFQAMPAAWSGQSDSRYTAYEALQPPLYYWLMTPVMRLMSSRSLPAQVLALRWISIAIASLIIPLIIWIGRMAFGEERLALCAAAVVAVMPGMALDVARVGNDCLAVALFSLLIGLGLARLQGLGGTSARLSLTMGAVLGLGLLTKAYFLTAVPAVLLLEGWLGWKRKAGGTQWLRGLVSLLVAAAISGWWYWRNLMTTGTLSGLSEAALLRHVGMFSMLQRAFAVPWRTAIDAILFSHIYFGGWSSLTVRSWMYHLFYLVVAVAIVGLVQVKRRPEVWWLLLVYAAFWAGQIYNASLLYATKALAGSMGWYLFGVVAAEALLCAAGLARVWRWAPAAGVTLFAFLDLYTMHAVAIPYYTGIIAHKTNGAVAAFHIAELRSVGVGAVLHRLIVYKAAWVSPPFAAFCWVAYVCGTLSLMVIAFLWNRQPKTQSTTGADG